MERIYASEGPSVFRELKIDVRNAIILGVTMVHHRSACGPLERWSIEYKVKESLDCGKGWVMTSMLEAYVKKLLD